MISALLLAGALIIEFAVAFPHRQYLYLPLYTGSYLVVGGPVWIKAFKSIRDGTIFSEFLLMGIATVGAFAIGEYAEGVAVMLFYMIGEYAQHGAVHRARHSIRELLDQQPEVATVEREDGIRQVHPAKVEQGAVIRVKPGDKVPLDGELLDDRASFNTAALTGESRPMSRRRGEEIWAGSINLQSPVRIKVTNGYEDTKLSKILTMVQEATQRKAPTQRFMTKLAKVYTPTVVWLAAALTFLPYFFVETYLFREWFYRALIFLVVSCPCGLVISIPLGYFGGIGAASRNGILFKGSDFLDRLRRMDTLFMDKTGTLTMGNFEVQGVHSINGFDRDELVQLAASLEQHSSHPIGRAILQHTNGQPLQSVARQQEISGKGLRGTIGNKEVLVGNRSLLADHNIRAHTNELQSPHTQVHVAVDGLHAGTISIADQVKADSGHAVRGLRDRGIGTLTMLSGDSQKVVDHVAGMLGLDQAHGDLLPDQKYARVEQALAADHPVGFIGDGVNDAPVITLADVGIAMGGIGSDATVETADVVIQTDQPSKIPVAIDIARFTHKVIWQNIAFALGIKALVMVLATLGMATMWEAIFADVGVALIAIANAIRIQYHFTDEDFSLPSAPPSSAGRGSTEADCCCTC
ncbi:heavy metal translocating P-type ATPase [Fodinibius sediminis]|uniref:P-type Zn(2+) transporter n=1 Tax=Fodinibius sediminis TaxID=1214077 RepID=A0A521BJQ0_9BACT|nr:heavy metal translocating P-type ATPase [Fodinibius sediminis]SMO47312.1 Cd2+/Zn2+-exporting ATPase [Fodinibius sediminis]